MEGNRNKSGSEREVFEIMGMYTELIFGCSLKKETPLEVIEILRAMVENRAYKLECLPQHEFFKCERWAYLFTCSSYYFGVCESVKRLWLDHISKQWIISTRANIKNYDEEIHKFLDWIKPYVDNGSGVKEMYAISTFEESTPTIYYLNNED